MPAVRERSIRLTVATAAKRDLGRGIARLDPRDLALLGAAEGAILRIEGRRTTAARALTVDPGRRAPGRVLLDPITCANAGVAAQDTITLRLTDAPPARTLLLECDSGAHLKPPHLRAWLDGLAVTDGDELPLSLGGPLQETYRVTASDPPGTVVVDHETEIAVAQGGKPASSAPSENACADVGGLSPEIERLREMLDLPLNHPDALAHLGLEAPAGVLLYGPPGCGKTLLARAVAQAHRAHWVAINGPEVVSHIQGQSEAALREAFAEAQRHAPSIVFLDEVEAIAGHRSELESAADRRLVAQLLVLLDGIERRDRVVVIAATNRPEAIDPALRRPGRLEREIAIRPPDTAARREILTVHTRQMPLAPDVGLETLALKTHGFVGADLASLCREAALAAWRRFSASGARNRGGGADLDRLRVEHSDFEEARQLVQPALLRPSRTAVSTARWQDVGGLDAVKAALREAVEWPLRFPRLLETLGVQPPRGVLLAGPPGVGKTLLARVLATELGFSVVAVSGPSLITKYVGESERAVRETFAQARQVAPCLVLLDELDSWASRRGDDHDGRVGERVVGQLLAEMDGVASSGGVYVLGTTNRPDRIDPALLRPGRFERVIEIPLPDGPARRAILEVHKRRLPLAADVDLAQLALMTEGMSGAQIASLCRGAALLALRSWLTDHSEVPDQLPPDFAVRARHFAAASRHADGPGR